MTNVQRARPLTLWILLGFAVLIAFGVVTLIPVWLQPPLSASDLTAVHAGEQRIILQQAQGQLQNNVRTTMLQALAGLVVVAGAMATWRQVRVSREGQITDRLTHAIDQVGSDKVDIRVGGIYALERLARDSGTDRLAISEILAAFIRTHASWSAGHPSHPDPHPTANVDQTMLWLTDRAPDVRTAVLVLGRLPRDHTDARLALRRVDLRRTNFYHCTFNNVDLRDSNLAACYAVGVHWESCVFNNTDLRKTHLQQSMLDKSRFKGAHLAEAKLDGATLRGANLSGASLRQASFRGADLTGADLTGADFTGADLTDAQLADTQTDQDTRWPTNFVP